MTKNNSKVVKKAVITAAGLGTRLLPLTKTAPKELFPLVDKPIIQHVVEELVVAGVEQIVMVTNPKKGAVEQHFARDEGLEQALAEAGKTDLEKTVRSVSELADITYIHQKGLYGTATPVSNARELIGDEPFFVVFPDDFFFCPVENEFQQLLEAYQDKDASIMSAVKVPKSEVSKYGIFDLSDSNRTSRIRGMVEKPAVKEAPSEVASAGTHLLKSDIWPYIDKKILQNGEHVLSLAIDKYGQEKPLYARTIDGVYYDTGTTDNYLKAATAMAVRDKNYGPELAEYLLKLIDELGYNKNISKGK